ncbi:hypothetical protein GCM10011357_37190 [Lacimicrobium alkaliphilum]|uniref:Tetratricopeptide repeat-like domain-containing protein n=2 Tax=Lacimicrobium alkaliphilum TaxID=1526571 RepID=A0ABQ1RSB8_9ALTE|nr:hypothetical protein GCM10011357_37190 [Lacimicrobium alkaliphilum]
MNKPSWLSNMTHGVFWSAIALCISAWSPVAISHENHQHEKPHSEKAPDQYSESGLEQLLDKVMALQYLTSSETDISGLRKAVEEYTPETDKDAVRRQYGLARVQQHQHDFKAASQTLEDALNQAPRDAGLLLLKASVLNNLGRYSAATEACKKLLGLTNAAVVTACVVDTRAQQDPEGIQTYYGDLLQMVERTQGQNSTHQIWISQILAELALSMGQPVKAQQHIQNLTLSAAPLSAIALWADIQFAQDNDQQVLNSLVTLTEDHVFIDDALLLRLAMAEKFTDSGSQWLKAMQQRIAQRTAAHNYAHAAELAKFYLYVEPNPEKANYWAEVNYRHAKSQMDADLLAAAKTLAADK